MDAAVSGAGLLELTELVVDLDDEPTCSDCTRVAAWAAACPACKVAFLSCDEHREATDRRHFAWWQALGTGLVCSECDASYPRTIPWRQI